MEIGRTTPSTTTPPPTTPPPKSPDQETETQTPVQPPKSLSLSNGFLKRHNHNHNHNHYHHLHHHLSPPHPIVVIYKECLKNHAASLGGHALDGCGEFMPSPTATHTDPTSLKCAACGCHRNFHRREHDDSNTTTTATTIEYQSLHRHHPPPPPRHNSASPPPISSYPSAPHMLLALSGGANDGSGLTVAAGSSRKRFRTKFSQIQKEKMYEFAERVGWRIQKKDDEVIQQFCHQIGVDKGVLKVWMHNNKNTINKRSEPNGNATNTIDHHHHHQRFDHNHDNAAQVNTNGSSSSC